MHSPSDTRTVLADVIGVDGQGCECGLICVCVCVCLQMLVIAQYAAPVTLIGVTRSWDGPLFLTACLIEKCVLQKCASTWYTKYEYTCIHAYVYHMSFWNT